MTCFADTSAIVKLYADEFGQAAVFAAERLGMVVSELVRVELPATLWKKQRTGEVSAADVQLRLDEFNADFHGTRSSLPRWSKVVISGFILDRAALVAGNRGCAPTTPFNSPRHWPHARSIPLWIASCASTRA